MYRTGHTVLSYPVLSCPSSSLHSCQSRTPCASCPESWRVRKRGKQVNKSIAKTGHQIEVRSERRWAGEISPRGTHRLSDRDRCPSEEPNGSIQLLQTSKYTQLVIPSSQSHLIPSHPSHLIPHASSCLSMINAHHFHCSNAPMRRCADAPTLPTRRRRPQQLPAGPHADPGSATFAG